MLFKFIDTHVVMIAFDLEKTTRQNTYFRRVLSTTKHQQLVVMSLGKDGISKEVHHDTDQFFRVEEGSIRVIINDKEMYTIKEGGSITISAGQHHQIDTLDKDGQIGSEDSYAKIYTIYSPPHHPPRTKQREDPEKTKKTS